MVCWSWAGVQCMWDLVRHLQFPLLSWHLPVLLQLCCAFDGGLPTSRIRGRPSASAVCCVWAHQRNRAWSWRPTTGTACNRNIGMSSVFLFWFFVYCSPLAWSFLNSLISRYASYTILRLCCSIWINRLLCCRYCIVLNCPVPMLRRVSPSTLVMLLPYCSLLLCRSPEEAWKRWR